MPPFTPQLGGDHRPGMGGAKVKSRDCHLCKEARHVQQRGNLCPFCVASMRRGGDEPRFKESGGRRTQSFLWANSAFQHAVLKLSKELRAEEGARQASEENQKREVEAAKFAALVAANLSKLSEGDGS